jgi:hypothetical protein
MVWLPFANAVLGVQVQLPLLLVMALQIGTPPSVTCTVLPASAVPLMGGMLLLVVLLAAGVVMAGAVGAALSTVIAVGALAGLVLPLGSVLDAVMLCGPLLSGVLGVQVHAPLAFATAVQIVVGPSFTVTVLLGSAVPLIVGVVSLTTLPGAGEVIAGAAGAVLSTVMGRVLGAPVLPAGSVAVAFSVCGPSLSAKGGVQLQLPLASTTAVQITGPPAPSVTLTVLLGSPVPLMVGVVSLTTALAAGETIAGGTGAVLSIVIGVLAAGPVLPVGSVAVVLKVCGPSLNGVLGVHVHEPAALAVAVQSTGPPGPSRTVTVLLGSAEPEIVGVVSLSGLPLLGEVTVGAAGPTVSTVNVRVVGGLVLPAGSVAVTANACGPSLKGVVGVQLQLPLPSAVAVQMGTPPSLTVTVLPGSAVPFMVGVLSLVVLPVVGEITVGAAGAVLSIVNVRVGDVALPPPESVTVAAMVCEPLLSGVLGVQLQLPLASAVVVQIIVAPSFTTTVPLGVPVPTMVGVVSLTACPAVGLLMAGVMALLTVKFCVSGALVLPAESVLNAVML